MNLALGGLLVISVEQTGNSAQTSYRVPVCVSHVSASKLTNEIISVVQFIY